MCQLSCSFPDKHLSFYFYKTGLMGELEPNQLSVVLKNLDTGKQRRLDCQQNPNTPSEPFFTLQSEDGDKGGFCFVPEQRADLVNNPFSVHLPDVENGNYLFVLDHGGEIVSEFEYTVKHDYRLCHSCSNISFELDDDLQPRENL